MDLINNNANIFFFVTTILVVVLIVILLIVLFATIKIYRFIKKAVDKGDLLLDDVKENNFFKKAVPIVLPVILPIVSFFYKLKKKKK
jgi:heme/copper-type cytochrome/quinol oxidase subunit 2